MKKYYLHNGTEQQGPFDLEELKSKNLNRTTPIWHEGLSDWTTVEKVEELNLLFGTIPPPFSPPPAPKKAPSKPSDPLEPKKKKKSGNYLLVIGIAFIIAGVIVGYNNKIKWDSLGRANSETYEEKVMTIEEIERSQPTNFLSVDFKYKENFWGDKLKVSGTITNKATVASYKDAVVRITYYSKTNTALGSKDFTIYEVFPPTSSKGFELKIDNYKNVNAVGGEVISAIAN